MNDPSVELLRRQRPQGRQVVQFSLNYLPSPFPLYFCCLVLCPNPVNIPLPPPLCSFLCVLLVVLDCWRLPCIGLYQRMSAQSSAKSRTLPFTTFQPFPGCFRPSSFVLSKFVAIPSLVGFLAKWPRLPLCSPWTGLGSPHVPVHCQPSFVFFFCFLFFPVHCLLCVPPPFVFFSLCWRLAAVPLSILLFSFVLGWDSYQLFVVFVFGSLGVAKGLGWKGYIVGFSLVIGVLDLEAFVI